MKIAPSNQTPPQNPSTPPGGHSDHGDSDFITHDRPELLWVHKALWRHLFCARHHVGGQAEEQQGQQGEDGARHQGQVTDHNIND